MLSEERSGSGDIFVKEEGEKRDGSWGGGRRESVQRRERGSFGI